MKFCQRQIRFTDNNTSEDEVPIPQAPPTPDLLLLTGMKGLLCDSHIRQICDFIEREDGAKPKVLNSNGRTALIRATEAVCRKLDNSIVGSVVLISQFSQVVAARKAQQDAFQSSLERGGSAPIAQE